MSWTKHMQKALLHCPTTSQRQNAWQRTFHTYTYGPTTTLQRLKIPFMYFPGSSGQFFALTYDSMLCISGKHHLTQIPREVQRCVGCVHAYTCQLGLQQEQQDKLCCTETVLEKKLKDWNYHKNRQSNRGGDKKNLLLVSRYRKEWDPSHPTHPQRPTARIQKPALKGLLVPLNS